VIAWAFDGGAIGAPPPGVELADELGPEVEFAVVDGPSSRGLGDLPALRVVQVISTGVDWIVDRVPDGVTVCSARGVRDRPMAEWVMAAILADAKRARAFGEQQGRREWRPAPLGDVAGLRVLVLGFGAIGGALGDMLAAFACEVVGVARRARPGVHAIDELHDLLPSADVVVNLLPLTDATRGSFGARELHLMREGALYVNAGRGATTDTDALVHALRDERVRAVLDVVEPEPLPPEHPLWHAPGVLISPHSAGDTPASERAAWALAAEQLRRYAAGEPLLNVVADGY
jgi:phosphoglycerate dehydrogenase-like enzyme